MSIKRNYSNKESILADALEAIIGAIFLDSNWNTVEKIIIKWYEHDIKNPHLINQDKDSKTKLQEAMQALGRPIPEYELKSVSGLEHEQVFTVICKVKGLRIKGSGSGKTIKKAEQIFSEAHYPSENWFWKFQNSKIEKIYNQ